MSELTLYTEENAPAGSRELLGGVKKKFGMIPNVFAVMAESPATLKGYLTLSGVFEQSSFTASERQVLMLTLSRQNGCDYCVAAHSLGSAKAGVAKEVIDAIRDNGQIPDRRLAALHHFCRAVVEKRGWVTESDQKAFFDADFTRAQIFEVVLAASLKTITNYMNHMAHTPLDEAFKAAEWTGRPEAAQG
ncbi:MAG: carboxymuconolactone decarboxylase family protein [Alphaproteobacteria bacterium]